MATNVFTPTAYPVTNDDIIDAESKLRRDSEIGRILLPGKYSGHINEDQVERLKDEGFTSGLIQALRENAIAVPLRIWILDNSGSMNKADGQKIVETVKGRIVVESSTRWAELRDCAECHLRIAAQLNSTFCMWLLNDPGFQAGPQRFRLTPSSAVNSEGDMSVAQEILSKTRPNGLTPLTRHIQEIRDDILHVAPRLLQEKKRIAVIIGTDGIPSTNESETGSAAATGEFIAALKALSNLPVCFVVRLCTDDPRVLNFYRQLDSALELDIDVLDDYLREADSVYKFNRWLTYALPLHRLREMGVYIPTLDMLNERKLSNLEVREFCCILFGVDPQSDIIPDPSKNWKEFVRSIQRLNRKEGKQWNPIAKKKKVWIDLSQLKSDYDDSSCCIS